MRQDRRTLWIIAIATTLLVALIVATFVWWPRHDLRVRSELAREAAVGTVAAAARSDELELESRFGRKLTDSEVQRLYLMVPDSLGFDPKRYSAPFANSADFTGWAVVQVQNPSDASFAADVSMTWRPVEREWRVLSVELAAPK